MEDLLQVRGLSAGYGKTNVIENISFHLKSGEILGITGESGCGKTTLFKSILRLNEGGITIKSGEIIFGSTNLSQLSEKELRKIRGSEIGAVFQNPAGSFNPTRTIKSQFIDTLESHKKVKKEEAYKEIVDIFGRLKLKEGERILNSYPFELSGGMCQRAAIALAMVLEPRLILADEPTSALDVTAQAKVIEEMLRLREEFGVSIIIISHNMGVIAKMADKIGIMYAGQMVEYGEREKVMKEPAHPYTKALIESIPRIGCTLSKGIEGRPPDFSESADGCRFYKRCGCKDAECLKQEFKLIDIGKNHISSCNKLTG